MGTAHPRHHYSLGAVECGSVASHGAAGFAAPGLFVARAIGLLLLVANIARAQASDPPAQVSFANDVEVTTPPPPFKSTADSMAWERDRMKAITGAGFRVLVSLRERQILVMRDADTLRAATAAVASGLTIEMDGHSWTFRTPRGRHTVLRKLENPVWRPPDWLYAEAALSHNLALVRLQAGQRVRVNDEDVLVIRKQRAGLLNSATGLFSPLPVDEHIVFNDTLYIPPFATK